MLSGKTALITGSTSGIGLGIATALAQAGCQVTLTGLGDVTDAINQVRPFDPHARHIASDLRHPDQVEALVNMAMTNTKGQVTGIDILINNAGIQHTDYLEDFPPQKWDEILAINLSAAFHSMRTALPSMRAKNWGRIINIASAHGLVASMKKSAYVAAKHGLIGLTKVAALETALTPITVNAICPGWVDTPLVQKQIQSIAQNQEISSQEATYRLLTEKQASAQFTTSDQIGQLCVFLCSEAASNVRGAAWNMDGGWLAQ
jgi:3-hydroxybutyrate dehydrogenase